VPSSVAKAGEVGVAVGAGEALPARGAPRLPLGALLGGSVTAGSGVTEGSGLGGPATVGTGCGVPGSVTGLELGIGGGGGDGA
jgi:hypothetical protein